MSPESDHRVLAISETPEMQAMTYYNRLAAYHYLAEYYLSPANMLPHLDVENTNWLRDSEPLARFAEKDAVLFWDTPVRIEDQRGTDPFFSNKTVLSTQTARAMIDYVRQGGALVVAGGVLNYGQNHPKIGSMDARKGHLRHFYGLAYSPLAEILPVRIEKGVTLQKFQDSTGKTLAMETPGEAPLLQGLDLAAWPVSAYHKATPKEGAEILLEASNGDPLLVRWGVGEGRVLCVLAAPRGGSVADNPDTAPAPYWKDEAVLWDRCLRWAMGEDFAASEDEDNLRSNYSRLLQPQKRPALEYLLARFPYGTDVRSESIPRNMKPLALKYFADLHMQFIVNAGLFLINEHKGGGMPLESARRFNSSMTEILRDVGLYCFYKPEPHRAADKIGQLPEEAYAQKTMPGEGIALNYGEPRPCPLCPAVIDYAEKQLDQMGEVVQHSPYIQGFFCDDEWAWVMGYRNPYEGNPGVACYSPWANAIYESKTGRKPPLPQYQEPGYVAPEDDPWLEWCEIIRQDSAYTYNQAIGDAAKKHRADLRLSNYPGGFDGASDLIVEEAYLDCWKESELEAFERVDVRCNWLGDYQRNQIPLYVLLGIFRMPEDKSIYPETMRLTIGASLAAGAKGLILWNSENIWSPWLQHPGRDTLEVEARRTGDWLERFGPAVLKMTKPDSDFWMLSGWFWVNSFDSYFFVYPTQDMSEVEEKERTWWTFQISDVAGPAALRAGLPVEFVTERQLLDAERLAARKAVFLPGLQYCRQGVVDNLETYIAEGGKVYMDTSAAVKIEGAEILPVDFSKYHFDINAGKRPVAQPNEEMYRKHRAMRQGYVQEGIEAIRKVVLPQMQPAFAIDSDEAAWRTLQNGDTTYLFVLNVNTDQARTFSVTCRDIPEALKDFETGEALALDNAGTFQTTLPAGGWKIFALLPAPYGGLDIEQASVQQGVRVKGKVLDANKALLKATVPIRITVWGAGDEAFVFHAASDAGLIDVQMPAAPIRNPDRVVVDSPWDVQMVVR